MPSPIRRRSQRCTQCELQGQDGMAEGRMCLFERRCGQEFREGG